LDWNTFSQTFSCLERTFGLNCRPQPLEQGTSSIYSSYANYSIFLAATALLGAKGKLFFSLAISRSKIAMKSWLLFNGASYKSFTNWLLVGCLRIGWSSMVFEDRAGDFLGS
jgi:hypothetical protein